MNFCQSYEAECELDPYRLFWELNRMAPSPFAAFYKLNDRYLIGSSPERFLQKQGQRLFSQPIKGTAKRSGGADAVEIQALKTSEKDRAENIMIVDLVRNDLSRVCEVGTVVVNELCGIYSYPNVHQMISSVSGELRPDMQFSDITEALFPM
jgi:para-aminobenzoate synthetase component 1